MASSTEQTVAGYRFIDLEAIIAGNDAIPDTTSNLFGLRSACIVLQQDLDMQGRYK